MASCRSWVKRAVLGVSRSLPVFPGEPTLWLSFRMSQWCQQETLLRGKQAASEFLSIPFLQLLTTENPATMSELYGRLGFIHERGFV